LLSTQRSGSTWVCDLLNHQEGITCGGESSRQDSKSGELLLNFGKDRIDTEIKWSEYEGALERAFGITCKLDPAYSIGLKLQYNQIPQQFLEDGKFE